MNFNGVVYINLKDLKGHGFIIFEIIGNPRGEAKRDLH